MGDVLIWSVKDVLCLTVTRTLASRVASRGRTSQELLEGSLGGEGACASVHKKTSNNGPSPSIVSFTVGAPRGVEMRIYPLSPLSNTLTAEIL